MVTPMVALRAASVSERQCGASRNPPCAGNLRIRCTWSHLFTPTVAPRAASVSERQCGASWNPPCAGKLRIRCAGISVAKTRVLILVHEKTTSTAFDRKSREITCTHVWARGVTWSLPRWRRAPRALASGSAAPLGIRHVQAISESAVCGHLRGKDTGLKSSSEYGVRCRWHEEPEERAGQEDATGRPY
ncbi:hypothetical protein K438DRAFT_1754367 [Mycena galopus ATCC 62051]|nr:hypothetical protein K438DRAFT_1754367 [Mycena galopus ATCC 62051]